MDNDIFERPKWIYRKHILVGLVLVLNLIGVGLLVVPAVPTALTGLGALLVVSPMLLVIALMPILNNEMRIVDSFRVGLLKQDIG